MLEIVYCAPGCFPVAVLEELVEELQYLLEHRIELKQIKTVLAGANQMASDPKHTLQDVMSYGELAKALDNKVGNILESILADKEFADAEYDQVVQTD